MEHLVHVVPRGGNRRWPVRRKDVEPHDAQLENVGAEVRVLLPGDQRAGNLRQPVREPPHVGGRGDAVVEGTPRRRTSGGRDKRVPPVGGSKRRKRSCRTALRSAAATRAVPARGRSTGISTNSHFPRLAKRLYVSLLRKDNGLCDDDGWNEAPGGRPLPFRRQDGGIPS